MKAMFRQMSLLLAGMSLLSGCSYWNAEVLNTSQVYPAFPASDQLVGRFSVAYNARDGRLDDGFGVQLELFSEGTYYEAFFTPETGQVFIENTGHWRCQQGHLHLETDHRVFNPQSRTQPDYTVFTTSPQATGPLQLLPANIGSLRDGQLFLHGQPSKGNFFPDRVREGSDTLVQSQHSFRDEAAEKRLLEGYLRESNYWARRSAPGAKSR